MTKAFEKIALVGRPDDERIREPMSALIDYLNDQGVQMFSATPVDSPHVTAVEEDRIAEVADLIIAVGGDGTMLYAGAIAQTRGRAPARAQSRSPGLPR